MALPSAPPLTSRKADPMSEIVRNTRLAARHLATAHRHAHALRDAIRHGDKRAIEKLTRLRDLA